jgi:calcineurin-like phosphoesterase family protein
MAWFISDTHFNHMKIIQYCNRPFPNVEEMNKYIINQWNNTVDKDDLVYHLGDFALQSDKAIVSNLVQRLNGNIILILGNHDRWGKQKFLDCGFIGVYKKLEIGNYILSHRPIENLEDSKINLHGHIHNYDRGLDRNRYINVSCEAIGYKPIWIDV